MDGTLLSTEDTNISRKLSKKLFTINDDEDDNTDQSANSETIKGYLETNRQRSTPYHETDLKRLSNTDPTTIKISVQDIKIIIKN